MYLDNSIYLGLADGQRVKLNLKMANRHGLIAGASGTGKTITMKVLAESFSDAGVPVFLCDVKGDVSGLCCPGADGSGMQKRIDKFGIRNSFTYKAYPVTFWDIYQTGGHAVRATISDMGPELLGRILGVTEAQQGVLNILFRIADDHGLHLIDLKDLKAMISYVSEHKNDFIVTYGNIATQSLGGIQRALIPLENQGGDLFFGEPDLDIMDWMRTDANGKGMINLLDCVKLVQNPTLYASFLLWMMSELFERLPEVGDLEKPRLVFFFDEAHMLFTDAPRVLVQKIEQVVKLIRSKGVGIYFVTQSPSDIPDSVLAQLSNRVQHALRAYTPAEQKAVKAAANSMRANPAFRTQDVIMELGVGEALVSLLDEGGIPGIVQRTSIICPQSLMAQADEATRARAFAVDGMQKYDDFVDNESAYEMLQQRKAEDEEKARLQAEREAFEREKAEYEAKKAKEEEEKRKREEKEEAARIKQQQKEEEALRKKYERQLEKEQAAKDKAAERRRAKIESQLISAGGQVLKRGLLNTLFGKKR